MADVLVTVFLVGFFALCFLYVRACDRIIGPDRDVLVGDEDDTAAAEPAATERTR